MKRSFKLLWRGIKAVQSFVGTVLFLLLTMFVIILFSRLGEDTPTVPDGAALVLNLRGVLVEQLVEPRPAALLGGELADGQPPQALMRDIISAIELAKDDDRIDVLLLALDDLAGGGPSKLHRIAKALQDFKQNGKQIVAYGDSYGQQQYFLAANADTVLLHPYGNVFIEGYGRFRLYYKSLLDKLKVTANVFRVGTFKSAVEPYIRDDMSPAAREANEAFLGSLWANYLKDAEAARGLESGTITAYTENMSALQRAAGGDLAKAALDAGLVDALKSRTEGRRHMIDLVGADDTGNSFKAIGYLSYLQAARDSSAPSGDRIGVIVASGTIVDGNAPAGTIGGDSTARLIRRARQNDNIKAIVLRVDSGGGSAFASEVIRNELLAAREDGKPVIASMSSVAASGGYWILAPADEIWAAPTTITGSIGIFGFIPTFEKSLDMIGVHNDGIGTTSFSGATDPTREMSPQTAEVIQQSIEEGYRRFLTLVAEARGKTTEEVDAIGQGRVWSGETALELGLVDNLGYLEDAIEAAARLAGLDDYDIQYIEETPTFWNSLLAEFLDNIGISARTRVLAPANPLTAQFRRVMADLGLLAQLNDPGGAYALCLACQTAGQ